MNFIALLLCLHMGYAIAATCIIMMRYLRDPRRWHIFTVGASHLLLTFSTMYGVISQPWNYSWRLWMLLVAYALTDVGLTLFLILGRPRQPVG